MIDMKHPLLRTALHLGTPRSIITAIVTTVNDEMKKMRDELTAEFHDAVKRMAARENMTASHFIEVLVRAASDEELPETTHRGLEHAERARTARTYKRKEQPHIEVPPPAPVLAASTPRRFNGAPPPTAIPSPVLIRSIHREAQVAVGPKPGIDSFRGASDPTYQSWRRRVGAEFLKRLKAAGIHVEVAS